MRKLILVILLMIGISSTGVSQNPEIWGTLKISGKINDKWKIDVEVEERYNFLSHNIRYTHYDLGGIYSFNKRISVGAFYREIYAYKNDKHLKITVPHLDIFYKPNSNWKFRARGEYIIAQEKDEYFRLRIRPTYQFHFWDNFNPFIQDEIFFPQIQELSRNRFNIGVTIKLGIFQIQPGYMLESNNSDDWTHRNIFWVNTKLKF